MKHSKTVIVIVGPTAVGKTAFAIEVARMLGTDIISADSRQCYKELNIGVAKPSEAELKQVKHYFINSHSISDNVSAADFEKYSLAVSEKIFNTHDAAVMVGGTGLYIKAFCEGLDEIPGIDPAKRREISRHYETNGMKWLQDQVKEKDPSFWLLGEQQNPHRLIRALEVIESTGQSVTSFRTGNKQLRPFNILKIGLEMPREQLYDRINKRVDQMIAMGLTDEVKTLIPFRHLNALQTVGYQELFEYFDGKSSVEKAIDEIKKHTRHYAKRQLTWFKKDRDIQWFPPETPSKAIVGELFKD